MLEPRLAVQRMRPYHPPTGNRRESLRLDFNENTVGCPKHVLKALADALSGDLLATYPDYGAAAQQLARFFGVYQEQLLLSNGTDEAIQLLVNTFVESGQEVVVLEPSYAMYRFYAEVAGAVVREVTAGDLPGRSPFERVLRTEPSAILAAVNENTRAIFLPNPNNPTGSTFTLQEIQEILEAAPQACVLVDEAYFDFWGVTALPLINRYENLFVSRTFSKAFGLAGMRLGCLMSQANNISSMKKAQSPYSVNSLSIVAALAAIGDPRWVRDYASQIQEGKKVLIRELERHHLTYWRSDANFVLFNAGNRAQAILDGCREARVMIRDRRYEIAGALRVTVGTPEQMTRFAAVLEAAR